MQEFRPRMRGANLAPGPVRLDLNPIERNLAHDGQVLFRLETAAVDTDVETQCDEALHLVERAGEAMHEAGLGQLREPRCQEAFKVGGGRARVQEERQLELRGEVELRRKCVELLLLAGEM